MADPVVDVYTGVGADYSFFGGNVGTAVFYGTSPYSGSSTFNYSTNVNGLEGQYSLSNGTSSYGFGIGRTLVDGDEAGGVTYFVGFVISYTPAQSVADVVESGSYTPPGLERRFLRQRHWSDQSFHRYRSFLIL